MDGSKDNTPVRTSAGLLIRNNSGHIVLVRQRGQDLLSIPKGGVEQGEDLLDAAIRETREETGLDIPISAVKGPILSCSLNTPFCQRRLFYWEVVVDGIKPTDLRPRDTIEIEEAVFVTEMEAARAIQTFQTGIIRPIGAKVQIDALLKLERAGWINRTRHPNANLILWKYSPICKRHAAWSPLTRLCRGLITDSEGLIVARPLEKFFEPQQIWPELLPPNDASYTATKKIDGALGISYLLDGIPHIATTGSFTSPAALEGEAILYSIPGGGETLVGNPDVTFLFEIVSPLTRVVVNYGECKDLLLIDAIDRFSGKSIIGDLRDLPFNKVPLADNSIPWKKTLDIDPKRGEGLVLLFNDRQRVKIKYPSYKDEYRRIRGTSLEPNPNPQ